MKCRECGCCKKGWFKSKPDTYVCIGVSEPFVINDINRECTEYKRFREERFPTEDLFVVSFDNANNGDVASLSVTRIRGNKVKVVNMFYDKDAFEIYRNLTRWQ